MVVKSSGERQPFDRAKLFAGIHRACHKLDVPTELLDTVVTDIEATLRSRSNGDVASAVIGDLVMRRLKTINQVAYVRFASVYRAFSDVDEFAHELARLESEPPLIQVQPALDDELFSDLSTPLIGATFSENSTPKETPHGD